jgi:hypothetical protein
MKSIAFAAVLMLSLLLVPIVFALERSFQPAKTVLSRSALSRINPTLLASGAIVVPDDPGSGGGGQGVIRNIRRQA